MNFNEDEKSRWRKESIAKVLGQIGEKKKEKSILKLIKNLAQV